MALFTTSFSTHYATGKKINLPALPVSMLSCALLFAVIGCSEKTADTSTEASPAPAVEEQKMVTAPASSDEPTRLGSYNINLQQTSVSGLSSGAFMTSQLYVVHSDIMVGAGVIAGGPYLCSLSWPLTAPVLTATTTCMNPPDNLGPNVPRLLELTSDLVDDGSIDSTTNLADDRLYLFSGQNDETVHTPVVDTTRDYFQQLGVPAASINYDNSVFSGHAIITDHSDDVSCADTESPYINNCSFMQSTRIIEHIYPGANPPAASATGEMIAFDQTEFLPNAITSMSSTGYLYVPQSCQSGTTECRIHVAIHGCEQGYESINDEYYNTTGYNEMADTNNLIVLYPQASKSSAPFNPKGCWDFWGYSSYNQLAPDFYTKDAPQIKAIYSMIERLANVSGAAQ